MRLDCLYADPERDRDCLVALTFGNETHDLALSWRERPNGANRAGLFINLVPIFGTLLSVLIVGENFQLYQALALLLVLGGIGLAEYSGRKAARLPSGNRLFAEKQKGADDAAPFKPLS